MKILLVEDDQADQLLVLRTLQPLGAQIDEADTLTRAEHLLSRSRYDCVVLDWRLPEGDATRFLQKMRRDQPELPVVVLTGNADPVLAERVLQAGAQDYLNKDQLGQDDIVRAIRYAVERQRSVAIQTRLTHADRLVSVGRLAAGIAHEVNNPAMVLMTNLSVLETELAKDRPLDPELTRELVEEGVEAIERISAIMLQLTGFSRQRSSGIVELPMHELLDESLRLARPSMRHRAKLDMQAALVPPVVVDRTAMVGVFVNLLVNAQQAIDRAPVGEHVIRVRLRAPADKIELIVEDTGMGVPEAERQTIFSAFVTRREHGMGLGLAICREVVRAHRGTIEVDDSPLGGARFSVRLPLDTGLEATEAPSVPEWTTPLDVLVIDDEANVRQAIVRLLGSHRVREAATLDEAGSSIANGTLPDVILCDLMLDGELGSSLHERLQEGSPELVDRVLYITGGPVTPTAQQFLDAVEPPLLNKPFGTVELRLAIQQLLSRAVRATDARVVANPVRCYGPAGRQRAGS